ncbi:MAG: pre-peptidase C-terminal domain-containing protein [Planctomycetales bacterium]
MSRSGFGSTSRCSADGFKNRLPLVAVAVLCASTTWAQLPTATLNSIYPAGGKTGSSFETTVSGASLEDADKLFFSHPGVTAAQVMGEPSLFQPDAKPVANKFKITIKPDVPPGVYEVHVVGRFGISNPRAFQVGGLNELPEKEPNNKLEEATPVELNTTVQGQADSRQWDYFKITVKKDQRIIVDCWADRLDSKLDAVLVLFDASGNEIDRNNENNGRDPVLAFTAPADGDYYVLLYDFLYGGSAEHHYRLNFSTAPYVDFILPSAAQPGSKGKFTVYGRNLPGGQPAEGMELNGQSLQKLSVDIQAPGGDAAVQLKRDTPVSPAGSGLDGFEYRLKTPQGESNPIFIGFASAPIVLEKEPNNNPEQTQVVKVPCEYVGQFNPRGDRDFLAFEAKKGEVYWIETISHRMGVPTDPHFLLQQVIVDKEGKETFKDIVEMDDPDAKISNIGGTSFNTANDDPTYRFTAPADGKYRVLIRDLYNDSRGDPRFVYRLSIRNENPDFRLVAISVVPAQKNSKTPTMGSSFLRRGGTEAIQVMAFRRDGFKDEIEISAEGLPQGVTCAKAYIGAGSNSTMLILQAADNAPKFAGVLKLIGKAKINDKDVVRQVRGGSVIWPPVQNQSGLKARMSKHFVLGVSDSELCPYIAVIGDGKTWETARGGKLEIPVKLTRRNWDNKLALAATGLPANVTVANINIDKGKTDGKLTVTLKNNSPVGVFTFYMQGTAQVPYLRDPNEVKKAEEYKKRVDQITADFDKASKDAAVVFKDKTKVAQDAANAEKVAKQKAAAAKDGEKEAAEKAAKEAKAKLDKANAEKAEAEKKSKDAASQLKTAQTEKTSAQKKFTDAQNRAKKPANVNVYRPSTPITLKIAAAPAEMAVTKPGALKAGTKIEIPVKINRMYGFDGDVNLVVKLPSGTSGLKIANLKVAKGQNEGKLVIEAAENAKAGQFELTVQATLSFNGQNLTVEEKTPLTVEAAG